MKKISKIMFVILGIIVLVTTTSVIPLILVNKIQYKMNIVTIKKNTGDNVVTYSGKMSYLMNREEISSDNKTMIGRMFVQGYNMLEDTKEYALGMVLYFELFIFFSMLTVAIFNLVRKKRNKYVGFTFLIPSITLITIILVKVFLYFN